MERLKINEIFKSIQGESSYIGLPCIFIRLSGCNLKCSYCDTLHSKGKIYSYKEILVKIENLNCSLIEFTGGEPLLQEGTFALIEKLLKKKYKVLIETNGSISLANLPEKAIKIMDLKCPDSGMCDKMDFDNLGYLTLKDEIKFVISSKRDYIWVKNIISKFSMDKTAQLIISPVTEKIEPEKITKWILKDNLPVRFQIQLHKIIGIR